jgi:aminoglycoside phosphotransferase (APT) family kinase protein
LTRPHPPEPSLAPNPRDAKVDVPRDVALELLRSQFPRWADLPLEPIASSGTVNTLFRLGSDMVLRLPFREGKAEFVRKEHQWLPSLAPHLTLALPSALALGEPEDVFPRPFAIHSWLEGDDGWISPLEDLRRAATDLATFLIELHGIDASEGPRAGAHNHYRGVPLVDLDRSVRAAIAELGDRIDGRAVTRIWEQALDQTPSSKELWLHGDLQPGNLLSRRGSLSAVIDFGLLGVGDAASDLLPAWNLLARDTRDVFRGALQVDEPTWIRGEGWALYQALLALPFYWDTNPVMVRMSQRIIHEVLTDRSS